MATNYTLIFHPRFRALDMSATPLDGGKVYVYEVGTSTPKPSYTTGAMTTANTWPVVLDANGEADIWVSGPFKMVVTDSDGVQQYAIDQLYGFGGDAFAAMEAQEYDKLIVWGNTDGQIVNSNLTLTSIETAVTAFNAQTVLGDSLVAAASGDASAGVLDDKLDASGIATKSTTTDLSGNKKIVIDVPRQIGSDLYTYATCNGL